MISKLLSRKMARLNRHRAAFSTDNYLQFDTLHSLNSNAVKQYESNPLFGTFCNDKFGWMTYGEFGREVDKCRGLLSDLGQLLLSSVCSVYNVWRQNAAWY